MTYLKTALIATALTAAGSSAAFAGDDHDKMMKTKTMEKTTVTTTAPMMDTKVMGTTTTNKTMGMHPSKVNDTAGEILQAGGQESIQSDREYMTHDGDMKMHGVNPSAHSMIEKKAVVVPGSNNSLTTVTCPAGTVAKADMTCMITGDYDMMSTETNWSQNSTMNTEVLGAVEYDTTYTPSTEYKGTLRPDTIVTENVDADFDGEIDD